MTQDLIERALAGDESAAEKLHQIHYPSVLRLALLLLQNLQDAEDATQDAFIYAFENLDRFDPERAVFATWLKIIVTSRCRDVQRRRRRIKWLSLQALVEAGREPEDKSPDHQPGVVLELVGAQQVVWEALKQVPRKSRQALILRYFGGLSYPEMAQALGCAVSTAKSRVVYGHQALARLLGQEARIELGYSAGSELGDTL
ncbi:MAG: RNA polymerase sigma factor [Chloroflexota bacterium]|nr:RNA polymerase sigma factor [Chloroflexota bacterium]